MAAMRPSFLAKSGCGQEVSIDLTSVVWERIILAKNGADDQRPLQPVRRAEVERSLLGCMFGAERILAGKMRARGQPRRSLPQAACPTASAFWGLLCERLAQHHCPRSGCRSNGGR